MAVKFLSVELVRIIQADLVRRYGGRTGLRDPELLESAVVHPRMTVGGKPACRPAYRTIFDKASAYGFHLCRNHPFIDGNKRVAFVAMYIFLQKNGWTLNAPEENAYRMMMELASAKITRSELSAWLKRNSRRQI
jgi:death on curing protein